MATYLNGSSGPGNVLTYASVNAVQSVTQPVLTSTGLAPGNFNNSTGSYTPSGYGTNSWLRPFQDAVTQNTTMAYNFLGNAINSAQNFQAAMQTGSQNNATNLFAYQSQIAGQLGTTLAQAQLNASHSIAHGSSGGLLGFLGF